jgi:hypothetical protein
MPQGVSDLLFCKWVMAGGDSMLRAFSLIADRRSCQMPRVHDFGDMHDFGDKG